MDIKKERKMDKTSREYLFELHEIRKALKVFSGCMDQRLEEKARKGFRGWDDPEKVSDDDLKEDMAIHVNRALIQDEKGRWIDIANYAMFLWKREKS